MNKCYDIKRCPAGLYMICQAYEENKNCFEIDKPECCKNPHKLDDCKACSIYLKIKANKLGK